MLTRAHLDQAVANGVITFEQASVLLEMADGAGLSEASHSKTGAGFLGEAQEERFRIANGFNEVFIALGVILLAVGMYASLGVGAVHAGGSVAPLRFGVLSGISLGVLWLLSVYLTGRRRMLAPSIVLILAMCGLAMAASLSLLGLTTRVSPGSTVPWQLLLVPASALAIAGLHYRHFKFPFSLQLIAVSVLGIIATALVIASPTFALENWNRIMFVMGLAVFGAAMAFDLSDPMRQTNRSDGGFWLHMVAAPLIVHPLMPRGLDGAGIVFAVFTVLALVAILVDRRAILVASLSYLMAAIAYLAGQRGLNVAQIYFLIPLLVGAGIIALGTGWQAVRRTVWSALPRLGAIEPLRPA